MQLCEWYMLIKYMQLMQVFPGFIGEDKLLISPLRNAMGLFMDKYHIIIQPTNLT